MDPRPLTPREREVLAALLSADLPGAADLRRQAAEVLVVGECGCGCPSVDFTAGGGLGMTVRVNAAVTDSYDGLFLYTFESADQELLGGIEWLSGSETDPAELPHPSTLTIEPA
ncbi:hypothetical protein [Kribbella italica]|uniref:Uncharacterized protein n=1 Tax=Kribbella italica TaxID=1540520 RepID=A0A7W9MRE2_9ACTN|nr:hypothetical protein [Kribbella italica]MBB5833536.1 hypothetical protein [Kribbella italica]